MSIHHRSSVLLGLGAALGLVFLVGPATAQISGVYSYDPTYQAYFITGDTAVDGDISANDVFVGKDNADSFTTLSPTPPITLSVTGAFNGGSGAFIDYVGNRYPVGDPAAARYLGLNVFGDNQVNISGGTAVVVRGHNASVTRISGGYVSVVDAFDSSRTDISGGSVDIAESLNASVTDIRSGNIGSANSFNDGVVNIRDGVIANAVSYGGGINISGGGVDALSNTSFGVANISGGGVATAKGYNYSVTNISGGSVTDIFAYENSVFNITGGVIGGHSIHLFNNSVLNLTGTGLSLSRPLGAGTDSSGQYALFHLSGSLTNGSSLNTDLLDYHDSGLDLGPSGSTPLFFNGNPVFVTAAAPEPGTLGFVALALPVGMGMMRRRRLLVGA